MRRMIFGHRYLSSLTTAIGAAPPDDVGTPKR